MEFNKKSLYDVLNIPRNASDDDIKKSYRKLASKYHPDKSIDEEKEKNTEIFKKLSTAYTILMDPEKREIYNEIGDENKIDDYLRQKNMFKNMGGFPGFGGFNMQNMHNMQNMQNNSIRFNPDIVISIRLSLEEIYLGKTIKQEVTRNILKINEGRTSQDTEKENIEINIEPGSSDKIILRASGNKLVQDGNILKVGNIIVVIDVIAHSLFKRSQYQPLHLYMTQKISVFQALIGEFDLVISGISRENISLSMGKNIIKPGTVLCINNKGMRRILNDNEVFGNLYIIFEIEFPNELTDTQRTTLKIVTNYVETKKKNNNYEWSIIDIDDLNKLLNSNNTDAEEEHHSDQQHQTMNCATQ